MNGLARKVDVPFKEFKSIFPTRKLTLKKRITTKFVFFECDDGNYWIREQPTIIAKLCGMVLFVPMGIALTVWAGVRELPDYGGDFLRWLTNESARVDLCPHGLSRTNRLVAILEGARQCPTCGYYCIGKGGIGCIDKTKYPY